MATVLDVVADAMSDLGILAPGEVPAADDVTSGLRALNRLVDQWAADRLMIYTQTRTTWNLTSNDAVYTVGLGGDVNVARPVHINHVRYYDTAFTPLIERELSPLTDDAFALLKAKGQTNNIPVVYYYNPTYPLGTITLWPIQQSTTLVGVLYAPEAVAEFTDGSTVLVLPPGYRRMIVKNLAVELASSFKVEAGPSVQQAADESMAVVMRANRHISDLSFPPDALIPSSRKFYNIFTG